MSLSRILNDKEDAPPRQQYPQQQTTIAIDPALMDMHQPVHIPAQHPPPHLAPPHSDGAYYLPPPPPGAYGGQPWAQQQWHAYPPNVSSAPSHLPPGSRPMPQYLYDRDNVYYPPDHLPLSPSSMPPPQPAQTEARKRKRVEQPVEKRSQPTRNAKTNRRYAEESDTSPGQSVLPLAPPSLKVPSVAHIMPAAPLAHEDAYYAEERARRASSDLDDCPEIWTEELGRYVLDTRLRERQVEAWFEEHSAERNRDVARWAAHSYHARLQGIAQYEEELEHEREQERMRQVPTPFDKQLHQFSTQPFDDDRIDDDLYDESVDDAAARELEETLGDDPLLTPSFTRRTKGKGKATTSSAPTIPTTGKRKRTSSVRTAAAAAAAAINDEFGSSADDEDLEDALASSPSSSKRAVKRKKRNDDQTVPDLAAAEELERVLDDDPSSTLDSLPFANDPELGAASSSSRTRTRAAPQDTTTELKKPTGRKRVSKKPTPVVIKPPGADEIVGYLDDGDVAGEREDGLLNGAVYQIGDTIPEMQKGKKVDELVLVKRLMALEEAQNKIWLHIARKDVPKVHRLQSQGYSHKVAHHKKLSSMTAAQAKRTTTRTSKATKDAQTKARRVAREMLFYWRKNDREDVATKKRAEKEALDKVKAEEEKREAARQARKLEFLITQTELYSHFVGNKLKTSELEADPSADPDVGSETPLEPLTLAVDLTAEAAAPSGDLDFNQDDQETLTRHAARKAREQVNLALERAQAFDKNAARDRQKAEALIKSRATSGTTTPTLDLSEASALSGPVQSEPIPASAPVPMDLDSDELNFLNPTSLNDGAHIPQPKMLSITLKDYQLKGLNWLATLYEQGINGILADEMGLGKTVQSISLLAYLIETHDIWGPFLVIAPASTLFNWQQELARFVPKVKALPYWGNPKDRALLRKFWSKKEISYNEDAPFNVLVTSYQMVVQDAQYFQKVNWQYMILDEAQAIKSSSSSRWKTLLGFSCRNRLLLTGTPIQNSMQELWALLHFIMPTLFDSHEEFSEWFSKDIETHAGDGGQGSLNEHQIRRLHMILKPFMLRRVKKHVQNELGDKIEIDLYCDLSARQRGLDRALRADVSVTDLLVRASKMGDVDSARSLMNLVMQFRKVCNHPDLFERADVTSPFAFCDFASSGNLAREKDVLNYPGAARSPISLSLPRLFYEDGAISQVPAESSIGSDTRRLSSLLNIWRGDWIAPSLQRDNSSFSFLRLLDVSPSEARSTFRAPLIQRLLMKTSHDAYVASESPFLNDEYFALSSTRPLGQIVVPRISTFLDIAPGLPSLHGISTEAWNASCLSRSDVSRCHAAKAVAPPIQIHISDRSFIENQSRSFDGHPLERLAFYGLPPGQEESLPAYNAVEAILPGFAPRGLVGSSSENQLPKSPTVVPEAKSLIFDSGKLARLDALLDELKPGGHRVLIYFQMTRMIDLMEEYMTYRKHKYLRLDGSSKLEDRRDMVNDWQTKPDIFVFLLSTRAGGLGINLTAADTVIFYESDWNPSNDAQASDRAHRLGQTRQVTVYRLITRGTIDERIVEMARKKKDVQDIVVGNKQFNDGSKGNDIANLLLNDEELALVDSSQPSLPVAASNGKIAGDIWKDAGDDFFSQQPQNTTLDVDAEFAMPAPPPAAPAPKKKGRGRSKKKATAPSAGDDVILDV